MNPKEKNPGREELELILDNFSRATKLSLAAVNTYGEPFLTSTSYQENSFCRYVKKTENGRAKCEKSYCKACKQALQWKEPYYFMCHAGLIMWALPLVVEETLIGAVMCGQVLFWEPDEMFFRQLERSFTAEEIQKLRTLAKDIKVISPSESDSAAKLLFMAVHYLSKNADASLKEQKKRMEWRNALISRIQMRKEKFQDAEFDLSVYIKRERRYLQYVRMGNKEKIQEMLPLLFTDMEILSDYEREKIRFWLSDFAALSSRAIIEAGADCEMVFRIMDQYKTELKRMNTIEELIEYTYKTLCRLFEYIYLTNKDDYISVLKEVRKYIDIHYSEKLSIEEIAKEVYLSPSYLCTLFKKNAGNTIHDYILRVRIEKSIEFMQDRSLSLKDIMKKCGFKSQSYYTKAFREMIGVTPGQYRNKFL
ncbi:PocR ligand-binding domain-containing protein [Blautia sp. An249]|uniref:PocR ligand-binding domain-containing protein n=1 Tax=Blautia sp. An249 TaxID=1965603 RepID=UPI0013A63187|nr:PocR ligand-binding domain-containing protein [Blautia sp. An249]